MSRRQIREDGRTRMLNGLHPETQFQQTGKSPARIFRMAYLRALSAKLSNVTLPLVTGPA